MAALVAEETALSVEDDEGAEDVVVIAAAVEKWRGSSSMLLLFFSFKSRQLSEFLVGATSRSQRVVVSVGSLLPGHTTRVKSDGEGILSRSTTKERSTMNILRAGRDRVLS
jgi:hypothetical protein